VCVCVCVRVCVFIIHSQDPRHDIVGIVLVQTTLWLIASAYHPSVTQFKHVQIL